MTEKSVAPGLCIRRSFALFEQLAEATHGWELNFRQLSASATPYRLEQLSSSRMLYSRVYFGSHFHQLGGPVLGFRTFALRTEHCSDFRWCGEAVHSHSLIVLPADGEFESVSLPGFDVFTLSLSRALLERTAEIQFQRPLSAFMGNSGQVCHLAGDKVRQLRAVLLRLSDNIPPGELPATLPQSASLLRPLEQKLALLVLACLDRGDIQASRGPRGNRMKVVDLAMAAINDQPDWKLGVTDLVARVGVSRRTLEHAFRERLGVSPAAYLKLMRLRALHRDLLSASASSASVSGLCVLHGFAHQGQLAADYRAMFGELPSVTLRRKA